MPGNDAPTVCSVWSEREISVFERAVIENTMNAVMACDEHGNLVVFNPVARDWFGLDARAVGPERWAEYYRLFLPDGVTPCPAEEIPLTRAYRGETVRDAAMVICAEGQPPRHVSCGGGPFYDVTGRKLGAFILAVDTTERDYASKALGESEALFARILNEAPLPMMLHADDDEIIQVNRAWEQSTGYNRENTPTCAIWAAKAFGSNAEVVIRSVSSVHDTLGHSHISEQEIRTSTGELLVWGLSSASLGTLPDGRRFAITMGRDITELRRFASVSYTHLR